MGAREEAVARVAVKRRIYVAARPYASDALRRVMDETGCNLEAVRSELVRAVQHEEPADSYVFPTKRSHQ